MVRDVEHETCVITWKPPADDGGLELSKYSIERCDLKTKEWTKVADVEKDVRSYCIQKLKEDSEYMFRITAANPIGPSEPTESAHLTLRMGTSKFFRKCRKLELIFMGYILFSNSETISTKRSN